MLHLGVVMTLMNKVEGRGRDGSTEQCTNKGCGDNKIHVTSQGFPKLAESCSHFPKILLTSANLKSRL